MIDEEIMNLTKEMVKIKSVNTTSGEADIALFIEEYLGKLPYYQKHPEYLISCRLKDDKLGRRSVIAVFRGEKNASNKTILLHGHTDTVGLEGFGALEPYACDPDELLPRMLEAKMPEEIKKELDSGDYMVGRGSCDMKSGDAVFMALVKRYSEHPEDFLGNLVLSLNPVEENLHTGMIESLPVLCELKKKYGFDYILAINNDFTSPLFKGDDIKTIYTGIGGKVLPCFYIQGKETHVGQCFEGFDASMLAAEITRKIQLSMDFADTFEGETTYPPSVLKLKDLKSWYNVQTAKEAFVYFNYFVHGASMQEITDKLTAAATKAFDETLNKIQKESKEFALRSGEKWNEYSYENKVMTYENLFLLAQKSNSEIEDKLEKIAQSELEKGTDKREVPIAMIRQLLQETGITQPVVVLYYAAPYCPHSTIGGEDAYLLDGMKKVTDEITGQTGTKYRFKSFYPSLSDSSYIRIDDEMSSVKTLTNNFPAFKLLYNVPIDLIKELNIPAVNFGTYGSDAHKWTERVNISYTFGVLPKLVDRALKFFLDQQ